MNRLKMSLQQSIITLAAGGMSQRDIARYLDIHRETVGKYVRNANQPKPAISPPGSSEESGSKPAISPSGFSGQISSKPTLWPQADAGGDDSKPAISPSGSEAGRRSECDPYAERIGRALEVGLSAQRIYQDLVREAGFKASYDSVKRFVRNRKNAVEPPFRRIEVAPGIEAQVDFGQGARVMDGDGRKRRPHLLRVVLSHSRKGYSEVVWRQTTEEFIRALENAFRAFGGVPKTLVVDNLKAAVSRSDWFDPDLNPKVREFCAHYGTVMLPTKPAMPRHKGKVEAGVKYVQNNALKGRCFESLAAQNLFLAEWERTVADTRIHGTTRKQVAKVFDENEKPALLALPANFFPSFSEAPRTVHRDGHVELQKAYYSVPPEYVGRTVWVRWETRLVRIFNKRMEPIAVHARHEPGKFSTDPAHIHDHKRHFIERGVDYLLQKARSIGFQTGAWAEAMYQQRGPEGIRVLHGLISMADKHRISELETASRLALQHGCWRLRELRQLIDQATPPAQTDFLEIHPLIRNLDSYAELLPDCFETATTATATIP